MRKGGYTPPRHLPCHSHHVDPHQSTPPRTDVASTNPQRPPWPTPPMPNPPGRLNVTKPTVSTTSHSPATSGATNPADPHHHVTTQTSEEPPNDETGRKAGADRHNQRAGIQGAPAKFYSIFVYYWLLQQHDDPRQPATSTSSAAMSTPTNEPRLADQRQHSRCDRVTHGRSPLRYMAPSKHWGARSAPRLPFPWFSDPRKVARQCQLTLALPLRGSLVISGGKPPRGLGYPRVFVNPQPVPTKTRARGRGCGFWRVRVRVTLENPRVARDIP